MAEEKLIRLSQAARKLNVGHNTILEFLAKKGFEVENNPNAKLTPEQVSYMTSKIPMGRTGKPDEIAAVVHFLSSPDCSFVTAQTYDASGGRAVY